MDHEVQAVRGFSQAANDSSTEICKYPDDFRLVFIGELDVVSGVFVNNEDADKRVLGFASRYKEVGDGR